MKLYDDKYLCPSHRRHGEIAAVCQRCYSSALTQQRKQWEQEREREHEKYLAGLMPQP